MSYKAVYLQIQSLQTHIRRNKVRDLVLTDVGVQSVRVIQTSLDIQKCRGFYLPAGNPNHPVSQVGTHLIALARGMNRCWTRFVMIKELMHFLDRRDEATDTGAAFELSLSQLTGPGSPNMSKQTVAEIRAFYEALGVLCPEPIRLQMQQARQAGHITDYQIALQLLIPEQYVPRLFDPTYQGVIFSIVN